MPPDPPHLARLAGTTACILTAAAAAYFGLPAAETGSLAALAKFGIDTVAGIGGNLLAAAIDRRADAARDAAAARARGMQNHDLHRLMGRAIALVLRESAADPAAPPGAARYLKKAAAAIDKEWMARTPDARYTPITEPAAADYFAGSPEGIRRSPTLDHKLWKDLVGNVAYDAGHEADGPALDFAAARLTDRYAAAVWEAAKRAWKDDDLIWPALILRLLSEILGGVRDSGAAAAAQLAAIKKDLADLKAGLKPLADAIAGRCAGIAAGMTEEELAQHADTRRAIDDLSAALADALGSVLTSLSDLHDKADSIKADTSLIPEIDRRLREMASGARLATGVPNNLPDPSPRFTARSAAMARLHTTLTTSSTVAVGQQAALWADGGVGKTMLAEHYGWVFLEHYPGGVFKITADVPLLRTPLAALAPYLGIPTEGRPPDDVALDVERRLESTDSLLILDNIPGNTRWMDGEYRRFLPSGRCRRVLTTREEYLADVAMQRLDVFTPEEGREVLARHRPDAAEPANRQAVEGIVEWFGGLGAGLLVVGVYMQIEGSVTWADYAAGLTKDGHAAAAETHESVKDKITYTERFDAAFDRTLARLKDAERRALDYAALLPEDMIVRHWLSSLLSSDGGVTLQRKPGYTGPPADAVLDRVLALGLLRPSTRGAGLLGLHRVLRHRLREMTFAAPLQRRTLYDAVAGLGEERAEKLFSTPTSANVRGELESLVHLYTLLRTQAYEKACASMKFWLASKLRACGQFPDDFAPKAQSLHAQLVAVTEIG